MRKVKKISFFTDSSALLEQVFDDLVGLTVCPEISIEYSFIKVLNEITRPFFFFYQHVFTIATLLWC